MRVAGGREVRGSASHCLLFLAPQAFARPPLMTDRPIVQSPAATFATLTEISRLCRTGHRVAGDRSLLEWMRAPNIALLQTLLSVRRQVVMHPSSSHYGRMERNGRSPRHDRPDGGRALARTEAAIGVNTASIVYAKNARAHRRRQSRLIADCRPINECPSIKVLPPPAGIWTIRNIDWHQNFHSVAFRKSKTTRRARLRNSGGTFLRCDSNTFFTGTGHRTHSLVSGSEHLDQLWTNPLKSAAITFVTALLSTDTLLILHSTFLSRCIHAEYVTRIEMIVPSVLFLIVLSRAAAVVSPVDNEFVEEPTIVCNDHSLGIAFSTRQPFSGHVFVKDLYGNLTCRDDYERAWQTGRIEFSRNFTSCGVRRQHSLNPAGVFASVIVKISFHPRFVSKLDRNVWVQCFYPAQRVATGVSTSLQSRQTLSNPDQMPVCQYDILGAPDGKPINVMMVGQNVYHRWICDTTAIDIYCMIVHSCAIDAGDIDHSTPIIDQNGCAVDRSLIADPEYSSDLAAMLAVNAFKYPDNPSLFFNCQIKIERKQPGGTCPRPDCTSASSQLLHRVARHTPESEDDKWHHFSTGGSCDSSWTTCLDVGSHVSVVNQELSNVSAVPSLTEAATNWLQEELCLTGDDYYSLFGGAALICVLLTAYVFFAAGLNERL
uniref:ZP domain-containing protein n=1 Tax=Plectus sambesii TaxID=2011161 RepID=A0A914XBZ8_9BILA